MELERRVIDAVRGAAPMDPRERLIEAKIIRHVSDRSVATINSAAVGSSPCLLDPGADIRAAVERITIRHTTLEIELAEGIAEDSSDSDPSRSLGSAITLSTPRDHSGRRRTIRCRAADAS
jgi:hypothetical protein